MKIWWLQDTDEVFVQENKPLGYAVEVVRKNAVVNMIERNFKKHGIISDWGSMGNLRIDILKELEKL